MTGKNRFVLLLVGIGLTLAGLYMAWNAISKWGDASRVRGWSEVSGEVVATGTGLRRKGSSRRPELVSTLTVEYRYGFGGAEHRGSGTFDHPFADPVPTRIAVFVDPANTADSMPSGTRDEILRQGGIGWVLLIGVFALTFILLGSLTLFLSFKDKG